MKRLQLAIVLTTVCLCAAASASAQQSATPPPPQTYPAGWFGHEFNEATPDAQAAEALINETCQPKGLDNIQIFSMQKGHNANINLHVYCHQDKDASAQYKLNLVPVVSRNLGMALNPQLGKPKSRIVGFYYGKDGEDDQLMVLEKVK